MNQILTSHFLEMQWNKEWLKAFTNSISEDQLVALADSVFPEWSMEVTNVTDTKEGRVTTVALYLPGRIISGTGTTELSALQTIFKRLTTSVTFQQAVEPKPQQSKPTTEQKSKADALFDELSNLEKQKEQPSEEELPEELEFGSVESQKVEQEFQDFGTIGINQVTVLKPTPNQVNPTGENLTNRWTVEQGSKLKAWAMEHEVTNRDQISSWLNAYCGLPYEQFNPEWVDKFIEWTESLREKRPC